VRIAGKRTAPALASFATLAALTAFIVVAWVVIACTRVGLAGSKEPPPASTVSAGRTDLQTTPVANSQTASRPTVLAKRETMVYVVSGDTSFYHCPVHDMHEAQRQAVSLSSARARGLVPCPVCFHTPSH
jgi:hypothetical protein